MIVQFDQAISEQDCRSLVEIYERRIRGRNITDLYITAANPVELATPYMSECLDLCRTALNISERLYPETVLLTKLATGGLLRRHADNCRKNSRGEWVPNHTPNRDVSAIYYLNDDFAGGELVFDELVIKPRRGLLVAFPSDRHHMHEVRRVEQGGRYTMPVWLTKSARRGLWGIKR
jgi:2-oxoglutarate-Fe(II)-dependent oxygenase superfamily protein